jgi:hypothetical protein
MYGINWKMKNLLIYLLFAVMSIGYVNANYCYQESANVSTGSDGSCGLNYTGNYNCSENWGGFAGTWTCDKTMDGNWGAGSFGMPNDDSNCSLNITYNKPINSIGAIWKIKDGLTSNGINLTIPDNCFNKYTDKIILKFYGYDLGGSSGGQWFCFNGTFNPLREVGIFGEKMYEEAVIWDVFNVNNISFNITTYEGLNESFLLNITDYNLNPNLNANLWYNNTNYSTTKVISGNDTLFYRSIIIPGISIIQNNSFLFQIYHDTINNFNTTINNQTVYPMTTPVINMTCPSGYNASYIFNFMDEVNFTGLSSDVNYILQYGLVNITQNIINGSRNAITNLSICINSSNPSYKVGYGEIQYSATDYTNRRYYLFQNTLLTNTTVTIPVYDLATVSATSFLLTAKSTTLQPYVNNYISLLRWHPDLNSYNTVEMGKTDDKGQTIMKIKTEDVDYRIAVYYPNGTLISLFTPIKFICQTNPCTYTIFIDQNPLDLTSFTGILQSLSIDSTLKTVTYIWDDPSLKTQSMNLSVYKLTGIGDILICSDYDTGATGILFCNVSAYDGTLKAEVIRIASPPVVMAQELFSFASSFIDAGGSSIGLILGALLVIFLAFVGVISPIISVILAIVALIPLAIMGNISWWGILIPIAVLGGVVIHFMSRSSGK